MRVFLTGVTGFIGSHVAREFLRLGHEVHALVRPRSDTGRIDDVLPQLQIVRGDLLGGGEWQERLAHIRPEVCVHLAWFAEPGRYLNSPQNVRHLSAALALALAAHEAGCRKFVGVGTCLEYEAGAGPLSETTPTGPQSLYAAGKLALGSVLGRLAENVGMKVAWLRLFYQYGPFEDPRRLVPGVVNALLEGREAKVTSGEQVRDYLHVADVASAVVAVALGDLIGPVNVASGTPVTVREVVSTIGRVLGRPDLVALGALPYPGSELMSLYADGRRIREVAGWAPRLTLEQGLRHTITWWRQQRESGNEPDRSVSGVLHARHEAVF